ncbi:MAG: signal peptidase II [Lachnospiraceae bacterium]|nr:signal peptidase II [Lachnospiraceae bacterium]
MVSKVRRCIFDLVLFLCLIGIDRITKKWAVLRLAGKDGITLIPKVLELYYLPNGNTGAAFGILSGHRVLFLLIALIVVLAIVYLLWNMPDPSRYKVIEILLVFIAAGGTGNMIDRFISGSVVDFIYISCINFPIFNVADMYVSICTVILALVVLFRLSEDDYNTLEAAFAAPFAKHSGKNKKQ